MKGTAPFGVVPRTLLSLLLVLTMTGCLSSCRYSDTLVERIVDQNSENVDYDNPTKVWENSLDSEELNEDMPELTRSDEADIERDRVQDAAVNGEDGSDQEVPDSEYRDNSTTTANTSTSGGSDSNSDGDGSDGDSDLGEEEGTDSEGDSDGTDRVRKGVGGTNQVFDSTGLIVDLPDQVQTCVAVGECANAVMMLAGQDSVLGADEGFVNNEFIQEVYADQGIEDVAVVDWHEDGSIDIDKVIELWPDALFVSGSDIILSDEDRARLAAEEISVVILPDTSSATNIKKLVSYIGQMYGSSADTLSGKDAEQTAESYISWHDNLVNSIRSQNGGLTTMNGQNYDYPYDTVSDISSSMQWTIYISDWDETAVYTATPSDRYLWTATGVAIARTGYTWSPLNYYMSVGGVNNNAAQFHVSSAFPSSLYYVWQFNTGQLSPGVNGTYDTYWSNRSITVSDLATNGYQDCLTISQNLFGDSGTEGSTSLGCDDFRNVIVANQRIAELFIAARDQGTATQTGLYAAYECQAESYDGNYIGLIDAAGVFNAAYIGFVPGTSAESTIQTKRSVAYDRYLNGENPYEIIVNPHGLYSSWTDGSLEAALECQWIYDLYHSDGDFSQTRSAIRNFYSTFYGYDLSDAQIDQILAGAEN